MEPGGSDKIYFNGATYIAAAVERNVYNLCISSDLSIQEQREACEETCKPACSLNLLDMVEYISDPLCKALQDHYGYVRKTGVMGILKLYNLDQEAFERCNFIDILYDMLRDSDASVVSNCIIVLEEIMAKSEDGGMAINRAIMLHLLNRIH